MNPLVSHWSASLPALATYAVLAAAHLRGVRRQAAVVGRHNGRLPDAMAREAVVFQAGLLVALLAVVSPIGYWSHRLVWVRSVQDLLFANVAAGLIVAGAPWAALRAAWPGQPAQWPVAPPGWAVRRGDGVAGGQTHGGQPRARRRARMSVLAVVAFCVVWCGWHVPVLYDAALGHPVVYAIEVISYLGLGVVFWLQLIGSRPRSPALPPLQRVMALTGTVTVGTVLAMVLVFGSRVVYPGYLASAHGLMGLVNDQQVGGGVLWVLMLPSYLLTGILLLMQWLTEEDTQGQALTAGLDRLLEPGRPTWPSRAGWR